jgi:hypothetical protein
MTDKTTDTAIAALQPTILEATTERLLHAAKGHAMVNLDGTLSVDREWLLDYTRRCMIEGARTLGIFVRTAPHDDIPAAVRELLDGRAR